MIKNFVCVFLIVTIATIVFAGRGIEEDILSRCKHVQCKNVVDLRLEAKIRNCIKTTCNESTYRKTGLVGVCKEACKDEMKSSLQNVPVGEQTKIFDYDWLD